jgi:NAD(P)-dependent dehydrogenase (short-subunit alcohol dehydrogenase family)
MRGRGAAVITGCTDGIGIPTLEALLLAGFDRVFHLCRNLRKAASVTKRLRRRLGASLVDARLVTIRTSLDDLASVRAAAVTVDEQTGAAGVALLVCNAGIMMTPYAGTVQGFEMQFGVNHVAHFVLSECLLPALRRAGDVQGPTRPARIVCVSSVMHASAAATPDGLRPELFLFKPELRQAYNRATAYGVSKLANALMALELDHRCRRLGWNVAAFSLMPGVIATGLFDSIPCGCLFANCARPCLKSTGQGAATTLFCALAPEALEHRGGYFEDCAFGHASSKASSLENGERLAQLTRDLVQAQFGSAKLPHKQIRRRRRRVQRNGAAFTESL